MAESRNLKLQYYSRRLCGIISRGVAGGGHDGGDLKVYLYPKIMFSYVKEMHFSSPLHQLSEKIKGVNK